ncbi:hypothetical protein HUW62_35550 [Myxococcus sp. AM011]|uniref:DUF6891 domain-containing protein n=1 Tax=Myxococcus sp. AM011 TaxID=2745200 RepID=UPI0015960DD6|nr:hypothetical protein [Myxococcus sp. AM011]NVJ26547.1 hypothetical protein [Myxococcus sp. AM011]
MNERQRKQVKVLAEQVLKGAGDVVVEWGSDGHLEAGLTQVDEETGEVLSRLFVSTRGDVVRPRLAARLGVAAQAEELARRLGALKLAPRKEAPLRKQELKLIPGALEHLTRVFDYGTYPLESVFDYTNGGDWDSLEDERVKRLVLEQFVAHVRARREEEKTWPDVLEADRVEAAFASLERAGIVAEMGATDTQSSGWSLVRELAVELRAKGKKPWGAAFFHEQDLEGAFEGEAMCISFGTLDKERSDKDLDVARAVIKALRKQGFEPEWPGTADSRIELLPAFVWRRRRARVDTTKRLELGPSEYSLFPGGLVEFLPRLHVLSFWAHRQRLTDMRSESVEHLTVEYEREDDAREVLDEVRQQAMERFPRLRKLVIQADDFAHTARFPK